MSYELWYYAWKNKIICVYVWCLLYLYILIVFLFFVMLIFYTLFFYFFFFSSRRRHTRYIGDWSSDVCSSDLLAPGHVLTGDGDAGAFRGFDRSSYCSERRGDDNVAVLRAGNERKERGEKRASVRERFVHFPVAGDYAASHAKASKDKTDRQECLSRLSERVSVFICRSGLRRRGVCVQREIRGTRRRRSRCAKFCLPRPLDGRRRRNHRHRRSKWRRCWWPRRGLWPLRECPWRKRAFQIRPWDRSRRWSWPRQFSGNRCRWSWDRCRAPSSRRGLRTRKLFEWP